MYAECTANKDKYAKWTIYCDQNDNGVFDEEEEQSESVLMYKNKCNKTKVIASMNCGMISETTAPAITTTTAPPCDCEISSKMLSKMGETAATECLSVNGKKYTVRFYCDDDEEGKTWNHTGTCKKLNKVPKKKLADTCIRDEDRTCSCELQINKIIKKVNKMNGNKLVKAECDTFDAKKPTWNVYCDLNENDQWDEGEIFEKQTNKCRKFAFDTDAFIFNCGN